MRNWAEIGGHSFWNRILVMRRGLGRGDGEILVSIVGGVRPHLRRAHHQPYVLSAKRSARTLTFQTEKDVWWLTSHHNDQRSQGQPRTRRHIKVQLLWRM